MKTPTRQWHPFGRTEEEDLVILNDGGDTGWSDEHGSTAPWPPNFLHTSSGWVTANNTTNTAENPPF